VFPIGGKGLPPAKARSMRDDDLEELGRAAAGRAYAGPPARRLRPLLSAGPTAALTGRSPLLRRISASAPA